MTISTRAFSNGTGGAIQVNGTDVVNITSNAVTAIAAIENQDERQAVQIEWDYATEVNRDHPWVQTLATALGLDDTALTVLFNHASQL